MAQPLMNESTARAAKHRPALRLVKTQELNRDQWLSVRQGGIGSSDAAAAVGLNPYRSALELWMDKTGRGDALPQVDPNDETSPMYWGTLLEPIVAAHYTKRTGRKVRKVNAVLQHPDHPWMLANLANERDRPSLSLPRIQAVCDVLEAFGWRPARQDPASSRATDPSSTGTATRSAVCDAVSE